MAKSEGVGVESRQESTPIRILSKIITAKRKVGTCVLASEDSPALFQFCETPVWAGVASQAAFDEAPRPLPMLSALE
jgi:hypothetical protein